MNYDLLTKQCVSVCSEEPDFVANLANLASLLYDGTLISRYFELNDFKPGKVSWCGWYLMKEAELVLGPFQGKLACTRIPWGKGVCGYPALLIASLC